jgi:hypothetical protein
MSKTIWKNHLGQEVPFSYVPPIDKKKDRIAQSLVKKATELSLKLAQYKYDLLEKCDDLYEEMKADASVTTGSKGNYTITSFDKSLKIEVNVSERIEFDDKIIFAQEKINEFLSTKTKDADADLAEIVNNAFQSSKGQLDHKRVLSLFAYKIKHPIWLEAMELIKQSIQRNNSKRYVRIWQKDDAGQYQSIDLNFSNI